jgi:serine/threonine protein kinase/Leucine-rich repeat (LRR) protein
MTSKAPAFHTTIQPRWNKTLDANHEPGKTISGNRTATQDLPKNSLTLNVHALGYQVGKELGRGGLGLVSSAKQLIFDRSVAIKRLLTGATDPDASMKFFAEALITAQLEHPNIVPIHDLITDSEGQLQLVMKRIEGLSWRDLLYPRNKEHLARAHDFAIDDHLDILLKVCDAVSFAHQKGILHRDLKPENVMVGTFGEVLVMDWGCAVAFGNGGHHPVVPHIDKAPQISGTPSYMAPEMALEQTERIGPHSDVYQLGAVLYEVLTLQKPHRGASVYAVLADAIQGSVVPPAQAAPLRDIPDELADICLAALVKDSDARIRMVSEFAQRIKDYRRHAQAIALEASARAHLSAAVKQRNSADDDLRKAVSAAEQAREIWPGWRTAEQTQLDATLAYARHHLEVGAATLAVVHANRAMTLAQELGRKDLATTANALSVKARATAATQAARQRQLRLARLGLVVASVVLVIGLAIFLMVVTAEQHRTLAEQRRTLAEQQRTVAALAEAKQALAALTSEQAARSSDQKTSAPALIAQARKAIAAKDWNAAITALNTAIEFNPKLTEAHQLLANIYAVAKRYDEAQKAGLRWQETSNGEANSTQLIALCRALAAKLSPVKTAETQLQLTELFERQNLYTLAETTAISPEKRLAIYRKHIDATWPGVGAGISMREDGKLVAALSDNPRGFTGRSTLVDLEPIRGLPFAELNLTSTGVKKIDALAGMPLEALSLEQTAISDLSPLRGLALKELNISQTKVSDLTPLRGMPLTKMIMKECQVTDLTPLTGAPISDIVIGTRVQNLTPLRGMPLELCEIIATGDLDLSPLTASPLVSFSVGTSGIIDLAALPTSLSTLNLWGTTLRRTADLKRFNLHALQFDSVNPAIDIHHLASEKLETFRANRTHLLAFDSFSAPRLKSFSFGTHGDIHSGIMTDLDLAPLMASPLTEIQMGDMTPQTWRSLFALRNSPTLTKVFIDNNNAWIPVAEFWRRYQPDSIGIGK